MNTGTSTATLNYTVKRRDADDCSVNAQFNLYDSSFDAQLPQQGCLESQGNFGGVCHDESVSVAPGETFFIEVSSIFADEVFVYDFVVESFSADLIVTEQ